MKPLSYFLMDVLALVLLALGGLSSVNPSQLDIVE